MHWRLFWCRMEGTWEEKAPSWWRKGAQRFGVSPAEGAHFSAHLEPIQCSHVLGPASREARDQALSVVTFGILNSGFCLWPQVGASWQSAEQVGALWTRLLWLSAPSAVQELEPHRPSQPLPHHPPFPPLATRYAELCLLPTISQHSGKGFCLFSLSLMESKPRQTPQKERQTKDLTIKNTISQQAFK